VRPKISKIILSDRFILSTAIIAVLLLIFTITILVSSNDTEQKNKVLRAQLAEMESLRDDLVNTKDIVESKEKKIGLTEVTGVVSALEGILNSLGVEAKVIKPLEKNIKGEFSEEDAELTIEDIDLNRLVNFLYFIENSPMPLKIKDVDIKSTFENPDKFILHLTASLIDK
jgi:hypothetical protein